MLFFTPVRNFGGYHMEILLIGVGLYFLGKWIYDKCTTNHHVFTSAELDAMNREMVGKSKKECQQIIKKYSK